MKKISDQSYGFLFAILYFIPFINYVGDNFFLGKKIKVTEGDVYVIAFLFELMLLMTFFFVFLEYDLFKKGLIKHRNNFRPFRYIKENIKEIFWIEIFAYFVVLLVSSVLFNIFNKRIVKYLENIKSGLLWHCFFGGVIIFGIYFLTKNVNFNLLKNKIKKNSFIFEKIEICDKDYEKLRESILGKNISDFFMFIFLLLFGIGGIFILTEKLIDSKEYLVSLFITLFIFNIFYVKKKIKKYLISYIFLGSLPFGFIFPSYLPPKE